MKFVLGKFADFEFYCGENYDMEAQIVPAFYDGEDATPTFLFFKDGLKEIKMWIS